MDSDLKKVFIAFGAGLVGFFIYRKYKRNSTSDATIATAIVENNQVVSETPKKLVLPVIPIQPVGVEILNKGQELFT